MMQKTWTTAAMIAALACPVLASAMEDADPPALAEQPAQAQGEHAEMKKPVDAEVTPNPPNAVVRKLIVEQGGSRIVVQGEDGNRVWLIEAPDGGGTFKLVDAQQKQLPADAPTVQAAFLGVSCEPIDADTAKLMGLTPGIGLSITHVVPESPALAAGLKQGDVLTRIDDQLMINPEQLAVLIRMHDAGDRVTLHVLREGEAIAFKAELITRELPALEPGGKSVVQEWRVQQDDPFGVMPLQPPAAPLLEQIPEIKKLFIEGHADQLVPKIVRGRIDDLLQEEDVQAVLDQLRKQMDQQRADIDRMMQQMRMQLDNDLNDIRGNEVHPPDLRGAQRMQSQINWNDGQHMITIRSDGDGQHLNVQSKQGDVLFDGPLPADDRHKVFEAAGVSQAVQDKIEQVLDTFDIRIEPPQAEPVPDDGMNL